MGYKTKIRDALQQLSLRLTDRGGPDPRTMLHACVKEMEQGRKNLLEKTFVPNLYRVYLRGKDIAEMGPLLESIRRELTAHVAGEIRRRKYATTTPGIIVDIVEYSELGRKSFRVDAMFTEEEPAPTSGEPMEPPSAASPPAEAPIPPTAPPQRPTTPAAAQPTRAAEKDRTTRILPGHTTVLEVLNGEESGRVIQLGSGRHSFGRGEQAAVCLADPTEFLSRIHAEILIDDDEVTLEDRGSANGTFVNDARVERSTLRPGDRIRLGRLELVYRGALGADATPGH